MIVGSPPSIAEFWHGSPANCCSFFSAPSVSDGSALTSYSSSAVWMLHHLAMGSGMISHSSLCFCSSLTNVDFPAAAEDVESSLRGWIRLV